MWGRSVTCLLRQWLRHEARSVPLLNIFFAFAGNSQRRTSHLDCNCNFSGVHPTLPRGGESLGVDAISCFGTNALGSASLLLDCSRFHEIQEWFVDTF